MTDREKVIKGLKCCAAMSGDECRECPYEHECRGTDLPYGIPHLAADALALLKELEPRVLTLEELKQFVGHPCWFESSGTYMGKEGFWIIPSMFRTFYGGEIVSYVSVLMKNSDYGMMDHGELGLSAYNKVWRCWTSCPTDEQRKAVKWK